MGLLDDAIREHLDLKRRRGGDPAEIERAEREALGPVRREPSAFGDDGRATALTDAPVLSDIDDDVTFIAEAEDFTDPPTTVAPAVEDASAVGIAHPEYADPEFDAFAATEAPAGPDASVQPAAPVFDPDEDVEPEPEPKHRRRLFGRRSHDDDFEDRSPLPAELPDDDPFLDEEPAAAKPETLEPGTGEAVSSARPIERDEAPEIPVTPPPTLRITPETEPGNTVEYDVERAFQEEDAAVEEEDEDILEETPDFLADTPDHDRLWFEQKPPPDFDFDN